MNRSYSLDKKPKPKKYVYRLMFFGLIIAAGAGVNFYWYHFRSQQTSKPDISKLESPPKVVTKNLEGRYLFNGTVTWARAVEQQAHGDFAQPFSQLDSFERSKYDAWSTDLECPITDNVVPYQTQITNLVFNCRPEFLSSATKYFNIFDLANNHTADQAGEAGIAKTRASLEAAGVQYFGSYYPTDTANICEIVALPIRVVKSDKTQEKASLPVAFCGWHYFSFQPSPGEIETMKKYADIMPAFAFIEMGLEYQATASDVQTKIAHQIADMGPEFVIANNPHWVQNSEVYKDKLIVYSLGNFIFDQLDTETNRQASIDLSISTTYDANLAKWLKLAPECAKFHDDCLAEAQKQNLKKVQLKKNFAVVAGLNGYKVVTHRADAKVQAEVEQRLNWAQTLQALKQRP